MPLVDCNAESPLFSDIIIGMEYICSWTFQQHKYISDSGNYNRSNSIGHATCNQHE